MNTIWSSLVILFVALATYVSVHAKALSQNASAGDLNGRLEGYALALDPFFSRDHESLVEPIRSLRNQLREELARVEKQIEKFSSRSEFSAEMTSQERFRSIVASRRVLSRVIDQVKILSSSEKDPFKSFVLEGYLKHVQDKDAALAEKLSQVLGAIRAENWGLNQEAQRAIATINRVRYSSGDEDHVRHLGQKRHDPQAPAIHAAVEAAYGFQRLDADKPQKGTASSIGFSSSTSDRVDTFTPGAGSPRQ